MEYILWFCSKENQHEYSSNSKSKRLKNSKIFFPFHKGLGLWGQDYDIWWPCEPHRYANRHISYTVVILEVFKIYYFSNNNNQWLTIMTRVVRGISRSWKKDRDLDQLIIAEIMIGDPIRSYYQRKDRDPECSILFPIVWCRDFFGDTRYFRNMNWYKQIARFIKLWQYLLRWAVRTCNLDCNYWEECLNL